MTNIWKAAIAAVLFIAWAAIVFFGKTSMPGADALIAWIQGALVALVGVHMYGMGNSSGAPDTPPPAAPPEQPKEGEPK